ncbi:hypothetical protein PGTUg99_036768 [Puccinia graminis f. sp. tritici]|uniref:Homeobox domain-containing protein n=1 Tax=Puccinia graminis f. sp. tritici TaxID=56615 RepID=A0A5B0SPR5_PUCGR|nr:hypothetical protein PGTUg99_036768 [Puccinia graminis f. sp. tritici]
MSLNPFDNCAKLSALQHDLLAALRTNDGSRLAEFDNQLSQLVIEAEAAASSDSMSQDEAKALLCLSHNVYIASTKAHKAQLTMDELHDNFSRQLDLLAPLTPIAPPAPLPPPPNKPVVEDGGPSSTSHSILKNWSHSHMTYLFPSQPQLQELAATISSTETKVNSWFRNARSRSGWSKLYAHKMVAKNQEKFQNLIDEYQSVKRVNSAEEFQKIVAGHEGYQLLDKIFRWFATDKAAAKRPPKPNAVRPWVREVLATSLASFRQGAAGILDSSKQLLPTFSPKTASSSSTASTSPSTSSSASTTASSSRTASTAPTSVAGSSVRSASRDPSSARASSSSSSGSPAISAADVPSAPSSHPDPTYRARPVISLDCSSSRSTTSTSSPSPVISSQHISPALLALSDSTCNSRPSDSLPSSSPQSPLSSLLDPALFATNPPTVPSSSPVPTCTSRPADSLNPRSRSPSTTSSSSPVIPATNIAAEPVSSSNPMMYHWVNPLNPCMRISTSKSFKNSFINYTSPPTVPSSSSSSKSSSPGNWTSPVISPLVSPVVLTKDLPPNPFLGFCPKPQPASLTILSSSSSESILDRPSSSHPSICSSFSKEPAQSTLSGQFEDAPEQS